ncbi:hypothetical protein LY90DRAFT_232488 [Neocallimastix californiae]|uniref:Uncharacterized protein n=1 Tax=Neocallimastix californiae TaxID=1754190 RepID=A0A1Y2DWZ0_9FUNG|nr:hypothetical protein LY90DRAFT_232488 [Neocallimastix californiae]|eukprot:ORY63791.1 hypothetical protein LY90DRAFT_232488 [Neocallimastix californiae]
MSTLIKLNYTTFSSIKQKKYFQTKRKYKKTLKINPKTVESNLSNKIKITHNEGKYLKSKKLSKKVNSNKNYSNSKKFLKLKKLNRIVKTSKRTKKFNLHNKRNQNLICTKKSFFKNSQNGHTNYRSHFRKSIKPKYKFISVKKRCIITCLKNLPLYKNF